MFPAKVSLKALHDRIIRVLVLVFSDPVCTPVQLIRLPAHLKGVVICIVWEELKSRGHVFKVMKSDGRQKP